MSLKDLEEPKEVLHEHLRSVHSHLKPLQGALGGLLTSQMRQQGDLEAMIRRKTNEKTCVFVGFSISSM